MATMLNELERTGGRYGLQTMCEGGGQANATIIERLELMRDAGSRRSEGWFTVGDATGWHPALLGLRGCCTACGTYAFPAEAPSAAIPTA